MFLDVVFATAEALLMDKDDLVQKGYGWALKAASEAHRDEVYDFVTARHTTMPRTAFRYALEKMPTDMRKQAMELR
jgi:Predicted DNA alkylation repair enzyme